MSESSSDIHWVTCPCGLTSSNTTNLIINVTCSRCLFYIEENRSEQEAQRQREQDNPEWVSNL